MVPITIMIPAYTRSTFTDKALNGQKNTIPTSNRNLFHLIWHVRFKKLTSHMTILKSLAIRIILFPCMKRTFIILECKDILVPLTVSICAVYITGHALVDQRNTFTISLCITNHWIISLTCTRNTCPTYHMTYHGTTCTPCQHNSVGVHCWTITVIEVTSWPAIEHHASLTITI